MYLRHPLDFINSPFSAFDYYWNSIFDDRLSIYDSSAIKSKFIPHNKQYILVLEVPGYDKSHIKLKANNHKLFIEGNIDDTKENSATDHLNKKFNYVMSLYEDIDQKSISSKLKMAS
ncbi:Hsp20/alpha crystallin family protein [Rickettsia endosymbiont of Ixodes scapularis]|uniref:Hsp20/alpha crystallin family protein n=1 Tax=Rickettsia endosymbiont of Ixodes scapularis TaxID=444612 RepID=UPI0035282555